MSAHWSGECEASWRDQRDLKKIGGVNPHALRAQVRLRTPPYNWLSFDPISFSAPVTRPTIKMVRAKAVRTLQLALQHLHCPLGHDRYGIR